MTPTDAERMETAIARFVEAAEKFRQPMNTGVQSTITLSVGGIGVWLAVTAAAVMLAVNVLLAAMLVDHSRKIDDLTHYLNAIYLQAPHLKPEN